MIFYYKKDNNLELQKQDIANNLNTQLNIQEMNIKILLECLKNINEVIQNTENLDTLNELIDLLKEIKINLKKLRDNISKINKIQSLLEVIPVNISDNNLNDKLEEYNNLAISFQNDTYNINSEVSNFILKYIEKTSFSNKKNNKEDITEDEVQKTVIENEKRLKDIAIEKELENTEIADNDTLLISQKQNKVFLPYNVSELKEKLYKNKKYNNIQEIINNEYIIPFDRYKNSIISRFKEAYNLMRKKEKASITDSLDLALELSFNSLLNPAIITACKNLDELDIYLDCLSSNELDKFNIFKIKYEILPR